VFDLTESEVKIYAYTTLSLNCIQMQHFIAQPTARTTRSMMNGSSQQRDAKKPKRVTRSSNRMHTEATAEVAALWIAQDSLVDEAATMEAAHNAENEAYNIITLDCIARLPSSSHPKFVALIPSHAEPH
jgi:hypothetical protein